MRLVHDANPQGGIARRKPSLFFLVHQIESYVQINGGALTDLSAQQITSCTPNPLKCGGTGGCMGSIPQLAYSYVQLFGLVSEKDWGVTDTSPLRDLLDTY